MNVILVCDKIFTVKGNLNKHIRAVHVKKKPFKCDIDSLNQKPF